MANVEAEFYNLMTTSATITNQVGTRIYPSVLPQEVVYPAMAYEVIGEGPVNSFDGYEGLNNISLEIDSFATSKLAAKQLADSIRDTMNIAPSFKALFINGRDFAFPMDNRTNKNVYRVTREYSVWNHE